MADHSQIKRWCTRPRKRDGVPPAVGDRKRKTRSAIYGTTK
ncbi:hypothetical protein [Nostoc sp. NMS7]|nr:hypothetical protein [Nostoc sp. NMS7]